MAAWILYALIKLSPLTWLTAIGLSVWRLIGAPDRIDLVSTLVFTMAATGSACYAIRNYRPHTAGLVVQALRATAPPNGEDHSGGAADENAPSEQPRHLRKAG